MQQATVNLLADMGVQPGTLQAGLVAARRRPTAPPRRRSSPHRPRATLSPATASRSRARPPTPAAVVASVEVSVDGGTTWQTATGRSNWSHTLSAAEGPHHGPGARDRRFSQSRHAGERQFHTSARRPARARSGTPSTHGCAGQRHQLRRARREVPGRRRRLQSPASASTRRAETPARIPARCGPSRGSISGRRPSPASRPPAGRRRRFASPIPIEADTTYVASYHTTSGTTRRELLRERRR